MNSEISLPTNPNLPLNVPLIITSPTKSKVWDADQFKRDVIKILTTPSINVNHKPSLKRMSAEKSDFSKENKSITAQRSKSDDTKHQQITQNDQSRDFTKKPLHSFTITKYSRPVNETNKEDKILPLKRKVKVTPPLQTKKLKLNDQSNPPKSLNKRGHPRKVKETVPSNIIDLSSPEKSPQMKNEGKKTAADADEGTPVSTTTENASEWVIELEISPIKESNSGSDAQETFEKQHEPQEEIIQIDHEKSNNSSQNDNKEEGSTFLFEEGYEMMIECYSEEDDFVNIHQVVKNKKEYNMIQGCNIEDAENIEKIVDPVESEIRTEGGDYQAEIPCLRMKKYKKPVKLIWSPDMVPKGDLERYTEKISKLFRVASDRLNHEILIEILLQNGLHIENAVECVKRNLDVVRREVVLRNRNLV